MHRFELLKAKRTVDNLVSKLKENRELVTYLNIDTEEIQKLYKCIDAMLLLNGSTYLQEEISNIQHQSLLEAEYENDSAIRAQLYHKKNQMEIINLTIWSNKTTPIKSPQQ